MKSSQEVRDGRCEGSLAIEKMILIIIARSKV